MIIRVQGANTSKVFTNIVYTKLSKAWSLHALGQTALTIQYPLKIFKLELI